MIKVTHWSPGVHVELPRFSIHEADGKTGLMLTLAESHSLFEALGEALGREFGAQSAEPSGDTKGVK